MFNFNFFINLYYIILLIFLLIIFSLIKHNIYKRVIYFKRTNKELKDKMIFESCFENICTKASVANNVVSYLWIRVFNYVLRSFGFVVYGGY